MLELTAGGILATQIFRRAIKTAPVKIRAITAQDVARRGPSFLDLEQRPQRVELGRYLCVGVNDEEWTCSESSMQARKAISEPDAQGYRLYIQHDPQPILATMVNEPFRLTLPNGDHWQSEAGAITWNGLSGDQMIMRVVEKDIFYQTYQFVAD